MNDKKLFQLGAWCAFGLAAALVVNGIATFIGSQTLWVVSRIGVVIFLFGVLPAVRARVRPAHAGWTDWLTNLAYLGAGAEALRWLGNLEFNSAWLLFGGLGLWSIVINILALRHKLWPAVLAGIGIAGGVLLLGVILSSQFAALAFLNVLSAGLGAVVLYPAWLVWIGLRMRAE
jgi:hypothetical protein